MAYPNIYNNGYQNAYNPYYGQVPMQNTPNIGMTQQQSQMGQKQSNRVWVQGEAGAKSFLVAPNSEVELWDSERQSIYIKTADMNGIPSTVTLDYVIRDNNQSNQINNQSNNQLDNFATKDDIEVLQEKMEEIKQSIDSIVTSKVQTKKKKED